MIHNRKSVFFTGKACEFRQIGDTWSRRSSAAPRVGPGAGQDRGRGNRGRVHVGPAAPVATDWRGRLLSHDPLQCRARFEDLQV